VGTVKVTAPAPCNLMGYFTMEAEGSSETSVTMYQTNDFPSHKAVIFITSTILTVVIIVRSEVPYRGL
jgi:hypothetical protein